MTKGTVMTQTGASSGAIAALVSEPSFIEDPYPTYRRLLEGGQRLWVAPSGEKVFFRYAEVNEVLRDHSRFGQAVRQHRYPSFVMMDPPDHTRLRGLVAKAFTPKAIAQMRAGIQHASDDLMERLRAGRRMELVGDYARPLPTQMITDMLGIPLVDSDRWEVWANAIHRATAAISFLDEQIDAAESLRQGALAASELEAAYFKDVIAARREAPERSDVLGMLMAAEELGDRLTDEELRYTLVLLLGAGHHTSVNLIVNGLWALFQHPDQLASLRADRALVPNAIEEMIRWDGIVQVTKRRVRSATNLAGIELGEDEVITLLLGAANRNESVFADPDRFDVGRANARQHVGFGFGGGITASGRTSLALKARSPSKHCSISRMCAPPGPQWATAASTGCGVSNRWRSSGADLAEWRSLSRLRLLLLLLRRRRRLPNLEAARLPESAT